MRIIADKDVCIGSGQCILTSPEVFDSDDDGVVEILTPTPTRSQAPSVHEAVTLCPSHALTIEDP